MTINYTSLLGLAQPVTGTESGTWGDVVNDEITALLEQAVAGGTSINVTAGDVTLTDTDGQSNQARNAILLVTGTPGTTRNVVAPSSSKVYVVINNSDSSVVIKGAATTGVTIAAGSRSLVAWNGSDFVEVGQAGDVDGPASSTDTAIARFSGTSGKLIQNSGVTIDGSNNMSGVAQLNATTLDATNLEVTNIKAKDGTAAGSIADSTGLVTLTNLTGTTADYTNLEVTNIKAKDGTAAASIADSTGVISLTSNPVFSGGTANGVLYLNGSKSATSGSAITFDGTNFATTGTASATKLIPTGGAVTGNGMYLPAANTVSITTNGADRIYIDSSGNVGIGTSSPTATLHVQGTGGSIKLTDTTGTPNTWWILAKDASTTAFRIYDATASAERMRIDSSGNVGIGVTPSAWGSSWRALQVGNFYTNIVGYLAGGGGSNFIHNLYNDNTNFRYQSSQGAARYVLDASGHYWQFAPSGTVGNVATVSSAMILWPSGGLSVGNTSDPATSGRISAGSLALSNGNVISAFNPISTTETRIESYTGADTGILTFYAGGSERVRITSGGQLLIGTTTSSSSYGLRISSTRGIDLVGWGSGRGEALNFTAHDTANADVMYFSTSAALVGSISITSTATSYNVSSDYRLKENIVPMVGALARVVALKPCTYTWKVDGSAGEGFIAHELQEVCPDAVTGEKDATKIQQVEVSPAVPATYDEDGNELTPAVEAVYEEREVPVYQGVDTSFLVATLTAAIQELKAITDAQATRIEALEAEVAALKAK